MSVSRTVSEIFSVKERRDLETGDRGQVVQSHRKRRHSIDHYTTLYWSTIVSIALLYHFFVLYDVEKS